MTISDLLRFLVRAPARSDGKCKRCLGHGAYCARCGGPPEDCVCGFDALPIVCEACDGTGVERRESEHA